MAGKGGGGAWKVAYADFVTAMMAFFMVMWISAQDTKIKENIANYFIDPMGYAPIGKTGGESADKGAVIEAKIVGPSPNAQAVAAGQGRQTMTDTMKSAYATAIVTNWLRTDSKALNHWVDKAREVRTSVARSESSTKKPDEIDAEAASELSAQLKEELEIKMPKVQGIYKDLMYDTFLRVTWKEVAEDLLTH